MEISALCRQIAAKSVASFCLRRITNGRSSQSTTAGNLLTRFGARNPSHYGGVDAILVVALLTPGLEIVLLEAKEPKLLWLLASWRTEHKLGWSF